MIVDQRAVGVGHKEAVVVLGEDVHYPLAVGAIGEWLPAGDDKEASAPQRLGLGDDAVEGGPIQLVSSGTGVGVAPNAAQVTRLARGDHQEGWRVGAVLITKTLGRAAVAPLDKRAFGQVLGRTAHDGRRYVLFANCTLNGVEERHTHYDPVIAHAGGEQGHSPLVLEPVHELLFKVTDKRTAHGFYPSQPGCGVHHQGSGCFKRGPLYGVRGRSNRSHTDPHVKGFARARSKLD